MAIEGLQPVYGMGPAATLHQGQVAKPDASPPPGTTVVRAVDPAEQTGAGTGTRADTGSGDRGGNAGAGGSDTPRKGEPGYREPTLPRLSAEALATALMTAEPDKAVVPRVLPAGAEETG